MIDELLPLLVLLVFDLLAFVGIRLSVAAEGNLRRARIITAIYWVISIALLGAVAAYSMAGSGEADNDPLYPQSVLVGLFAIYLPKITLSCFTLIELVRRAVLKVARGVVRGERPPKPGWMTRLRLIPRLGVAVAIFLFGAILWETTLGKNTVKVYEHEVISDALPAEFEGLRIAHISDVHADSLGSSSTLADRLVAAVNSERPDVIVFTGDYGQPGEFVDGPEILGRLKAPVGKFAVLGNHDFGGQERAADNWTSAENKKQKIESLSRAFESQGFTLLVNDARTLSRTSSQIAVLGVGVFDPHHGFDDADLAAAERAAGSSNFKLLLAHSPQYWDRAVVGRRPIDLTLAGHTHGAQIGLGIGSMMWSPAALQFPHWGGLYKTGRQYLNVNRGMGYMILPFRLNMPADVSVVTLRKHAAKV